jgi:hypothetical protein
MNKFLSHLSAAARRNGVKLAVIGGSLVPMLSHAAIDTTAATGGITDAQTAVLAVIAAMITMAVAVWGTKKVLRFFGR